MMELPAPTARKRKVPAEQVVPEIEALSHRHQLYRSRRTSHDGAYSGHPNDPGPDYPIPNFAEVYAKMRDPETGFDVADRRWRLLHYSKCFVGTEAVEWMIKHLRYDRERAIRTGQHLMDAGIIHHVTHSEPFSDKYHFFRFQEDDESSVLNMKRVWDPALPTRGAVEVAQDLITKLACLCEEYRARIRSTQPAPSQDRAVAVPSAFLPESPVLPYVTSPQLPSVVQERLIMPSTPLANGPGSDAGPSGASGHSHDGSQRPGDAQHGQSMCGAMSDDVDYASLAKSEEFRSYALAAAELQRVQLLGLSHDDRLAFFVNVYNALCLHCYVVQGAPTNVIRRYVFFRMLSYRIAGLDMTLDDIEHGILRGNKRAPMIKIIQQLRPSDPKCQHVLSQRDGRIHFVISAGTRSDPPVRILEGDTVQEQLHDATVEFLSHSVKIDVKNRTITLPRIFMWYSDDFPSPEIELLRWVGQYLLSDRANSLLTLLEDEDSTKLSVVYENFEWCVSDARFNAAVVRRKRKRLKREHEAAQAGSFAGSPNLLGGPVIPITEQLGRSPADAHAQRLREAPFPPQDEASVVERLLASTSPPDEGINLHGPGAVAKSESLVQADTTSP